MEVAHLVQGGYQVVHDVQGEDQVVHVVQGGEVVQVMSAMTTVATDAATK